MHWRRKLFYDPIFEALQTCEKVEVDLLIKRRWMNLHQSGICLFALCAVFLLAE